MTSSETLAIEVQPGSGAESSARRQGFIPASSKLLKNRKAVSAAKEQLRGPIKTRKGLYLGFEGASREAVEKTLDRIEADCRTSMGGKAEGLFYAVIENDSQNVTDVYVFGYTKDAELGSWVELDVADIAKREQYFESVAERETKEVVLEFGELEFEGPELLREEAQRALGEARQLLKETMEELDLEGEGRLMVDEVISEATRRSKTSITEADIRRALKLDYEVVERDGQMLVDAVERSVMEQEQEERQREVERIQEREQERR